MKHALIGNILFVTWPQVFETFLVYVVIGLIHWQFRKSFWRASRGEKGSFFWDFLFYILFGVVITFSTHHAGVLVVFSILVAPAALASRFFKSIRSRVLVAWLIGALGVIAGFALSYALDMPAGAGIVSLLTAGFFVALILARFRLSF